MATRVWQLARGNAKSTGTRLGIQIDGAEAYRGAKLRLLFELWITSVPTLGPLQTVLWSPAVCLYTTCSPLGTTWSSVLDKCSRCLRNANALRKLVQQRAVLTVHL
jgi:hypothetical protein